jgi:hypothetical protein
MALLRERRVRYILVHLTFFEPGKASALLASLVTRSELRLLGSYRDWVGSTAVFEVNQK